MSGLAAATPTLSPEAKASRDAESNLPFILGITIACHVLALISVALRTYVRLFIVKVLGWDDYTMIGAMLCAIGGMITLAIEAPLGLGRHQDTISKLDLKEFKHTNFYYTIISAILGLNVVKISVSLLLLRFVQHKWFKRVLWSIITFMIIYTPVAWFTVIFLCIPTPAFWDTDLRKLKTTKCYPITTFTKIGLMNTGINIFTDVLLATLPVPIIWKLQINRRSKIALIGVLSLGYVAVAMGIVKAFSQVSLPREPDQTFHQGIQTWGFVQLNLSIVAACMPALRPLFKYFSDTISSLTSRSRVRGKSNPHSGYIKQDESTFGQSRNRDRDVNTTLRGKDEIELSELGMRNVIVGGLGKGINGKGGIGGGKIEKTVVVSRVDEDSRTVALRKDSGSEENILPYHGTGDLRSPTFVFHN